MNTNTPLAFAHIGDLHITKAKEQNYKDLLSIISQIEVECSHFLDFVVLPGDNADNGLPEQYKLVETALKMLSIPVHIIPGDHDMEQGSLVNYNRLSFTEALPQSLLVRGYRCLYLDASGPGSGGPDFRFGTEQMAWLQKELETAANAGEEILIFTHTYPDDLKDDQEKAAFINLIGKHKVALVDMGHTHYNELANDGDTIFSATRSTGQIEEGPVGYSLVTVDKGVVSWRFKALDDAFPFVMITTPADYRLVRKTEQAVSGPLNVKAIVFGSRAIEKAACSTGSGEVIPMYKTDDTRCWTASLPPHGSSFSNITVEVTDNTGRPGRHTIQLPVADQLLQTHSKNGSDADSIGAWPENGIPGTQLGPNRNGKPS